MLDERTPSMFETAPLPGVEPAEFPLRVVPDWEARVQRATRLAGVIDRHLDYEAYGRCLLEAEELTPMALCPEQRVNMLTDVRAMVSET